MLMSFDISASKEFTTIPELAAVWRVSIAHLHNLIRQGKLPAYRVGYRYIISREAAKSFLERNATSAVAKAA
jgi:excisionase family DNA binding protein